MEQKIPLVVVAGPTASGKTAAGVRLAQLLDGEVISADSMQIYKYLTVGTAKPIPEEMEGIPHHLIDFLEPSETFSVADYVQLAKQKIEEITGRGKLPILVGGTGLYISSLIDNIEFSQSDSDTKLREEYQQFAKENGPQALWDRIKSGRPAGGRKDSPKQCRKGRKSVGSLSHHRYSDFKASGTFQNKTIPLPTVYDGTEFS